MDKTTYRKKFIKAIRFAPKKVRQEILADLDAILADPNTKMQRLGTPEYLAGQYLQDAEISSSRLRRILFFSRNLLAILGTLALALMALGYALYAYYGDYRPFDYADVQLAYSHEDFNNEYRIDFTEKTHFSVYQAQAALYSHDEDDILMRCAGSLDNPKQMNIKQNSCLIFVPKHTFSLEAEQSQVTLIEPKNNWDIQVKQTGLFLHQGASSYRIIQEAEKSGGVTYKSDEDAEITLKFNIIQSSAKVYQPD